MEKKEILKIFLERGFQLDSKALDFFLKNEDRINEFLEKAGDLKKFPVITLDVIEGVLSEPIKLEVIKSYEEKSAEISVSDISSILNKRYEKIAKILERRLELVNLISIGKIGSKKNFSIIGMVREKNEYENSLLIEDRTGEIKVFFEEEDSLRKIVEDEVIGLVCKKKEENFYAEKVIFPDIPLKKEIKKSEKDLKTIFISDFHLDREKNYFEELINFLEKEKFDIVFVLGDVSSNPNDIKNFFSSFNSKEKIFVTGEIDKKVDVDAKVFKEFAFLNLEGLIVLVMHGFLLEKYLKNFGNVRDMLLEILKKRHLSPTFDVKLCVNDEILMIDPIPDIFACAHFHNASLTNYKGTTIISTGSFITQPIYWIINLKSREILKLDLREKI